MNIFKRFFLVIILLNFTLLLSAFDKGWTLGLQADVGGSYTMPSIPLEDLQILNPMAKKMTGMLSAMLMGGELSVGYIFDSQDWIPTLSKDSVVSGFAINGYVGMGQGSTVQKITAEATGVEFDIFMVVDFLPTVNAGAEFEVLLFENRFSVGLGLGTKAILDMTPAYLVYASAVLDTEVGEIIVPPDLMMKMNPFAFSANLNLGYNVPILPTTELVLGAYAQFNLFKPKYLTVPASLLDMAVTNGADPEKLRSPFPNYWLNSLDFGVNIGFLFRL